MARSIVLNLIGNDRVSAAVRRVGQEMDRAADRADNLERSFRRVDRVARLSGFAVGAGAALALTKALSPLSAAIAAVPAGAAGAAAAMGTLKIGLAGVSDAMDAVAKGDAQALNEALAELSPNAQKFVKQTAAMRGEMTKLQKSVQDRLFAGLGADLADLGRTYFPVAERGMARVAGGMNLIAREAVRAAQTPWFQGTVARVMASTDRVLRTLSTAVRPLARLVADLTEAGLPLVERLAQWAVQGVKAAAAWVRLQSAGGGLEQAVQRAGDMLAQLGRIAVNVTVGLGALVGNAGAFEAASGGMLDSLERVTQAFREWASSTQGQQDMSGVFRELGEAFRSIAEVLPVFTGALGIVADIFRALPSPVRDAVSQFAAWSIVISLLVNRLRLLVVAAGAVKGIKMGIDFARGFANVATGAAEGASAAARFGAALRTNIAAMRTWIVENTRAAVAATRTKVATLASAAASRVAAAATRVWAAAQAVFNAIMRANPIVLVVTLLAALGVAVVAAYRKFEWFRNIVDAVWRGTRVAAEMAWAGMQVVFSAIASFISATLGPVFSWLYRNAVVPAFRGTQIAVTAAWAVIKPVFNLLKSWAGSTLVTAFKNFLTGTRMAWNGAKSAISTVWNSGIRPVFDRLRQAVGKVRDAFRVAVDGIKVVWDRLKGIAKTPVNFVIGIYNDGIVRMVNGLAKLVGLGQPLRKVPKFARGGVMPGYAPGRDTLIAAVSPGESIFRPEFTKAVGEDFVYAANRIARTGGPEAVRKWLTGPHAMGGEGLAFARGGVVPGFAGAFGLGGVVKGFIRGVRDFTIGNVGAAAKKLLDKLIGHVPGSGLFRDMIAKVPVWIRDKILGWIKSKIDSGAGGVRVQRALQWARSQAGKPYVWGGVGPGGYDCSGFMSAITNVIQGRSPYSRRFTTFSFTGAPQGPAGFQRNLRSGFMVGITNRGVGHMAGTLAGVPVESSGSAGVRVGPSARSATHPMFNMRYGLKFDRGGWLPPGWSTVYNGLGRPEPVFPSLEAAEAAVGGKPLVGEVHVHHVPGYSTPQDVVRGLRRAELAARYPRRR